MWGWAVSKQEIGPDLAGSLVVEREIERRLSRSSEVSRQARLTSFGRENRHV